MDTRLLVVLGQQLLIVNINVYVCMMHILIMFSYHLDVLYARTRHIEIAF